MAQGEYVRMCECEVVYNKRHRTTKLHRTVAWHKIETRLVEIATYPNDNKNTCIFPHVYGKAEVGEKG